MARAAKLRNRVPRTSDLVIDRAELAAAIARGLDAWCLAANRPPHHPGIRADLVGHIAASIRRTAETPLVAVPETGEAQPKHWWNRD